MHAHTHRALLQGAAFRYRVLAALALALLAPLALGQMGTPGPAGPPAAQSPLPRAEPPAITGGELPAAPAATAEPQPATVPQISVPIGVPRNAAPAANADTSAAQCDALRKASVRAQCRRDAARQAADAASAAR